MSIQTIDQIPLEEKKVFIRVDFNVSRNKETGEITDDTRIRAALPTIQHAINRKAKIILASHLGRPKGVADPLLSLVKVGERVSEVLDCDVLFPEDCVGNGIRKLAHDLPAGGVMLLENLRFHKEETANDPQFSKSLASLADIYINDAFGTCHRAHASTLGMLPYFQHKGIGFLVQKEITQLTALLENPKRPFLAILGGAKVSDKIGVIDNLLTKTDAILIGGAMAYTFLAAQVINIGASLVELDKVYLAKKILERARNRGVQIHLPVDHLVAPNAETAPTVTANNSIADGLMGFDIGPKTVELYGELVQKAGCVFWNGPLGLFEMKPFAQGTLKMAEAIAASGAVSVAGGGDSLAAIKKSGLTERFTHLSTGGGATLEFLEGKKLPGLAALEI